MNGNGTSERMSHYEVSKLRGMILDGALPHMLSLWWRNAYRLSSNPDWYSPEDEEQDIPRESWIPSHLRELAQVAVARLNDDYAGEHDDAAPSIAGSNDNYNAGNDAGDSENGTCCRLNAIYEILTE